MNVKEEEIKGKTLLDAGCGNGELTMALSEYGLKATGIDISSSVIRAKEIAEKLGKKVKFLCMDVSKLPETYTDRYDYVFCGGVLHHTSDTKMSFLNLSKAVKPSGKFFVWIYLKFELTGYNIWKCKIYDITNRIVSRLPAILQDIFCYFALLLFIMLRHKFNKIELREKLIALHDGFTPRYAYRHTPEEIISWFEEAGFENIIISDRTEKSGVGIVGTKKAKVQCWVK